MTVLQDKAIKDYWVPTGKDAKEWGGFFWYNGFAWRMVAARHAHAGRTEVWGLRVKKCDKDKWISFLLEPGEELMQVRRA